MDINALNYFYHIRPFKAYFLRDWNGGIQYPALEVYGVKLPYQNECSWLYVRAHLVCLIKLGAIYIVRCRISGIFDPLPPPCTQGLLHKWRHIYEVLYAKAKPLPSPSLQRTMYTAPLWKLVNHYTYINKTTAALVLVRQILKHLTWTELVRCGWLPHVIGEMCTSHA